MTAKEELLEFIRKLTPEEIEKVLENLDSLKRLVSDNEYKVSAISRV